MESHKPRPRITHENPVVKRDGGREGEKKMGTCGQLFQGRDGKCHACDIATPEVTRADGDYITMVAPFPVRHDGPHHGPVIESER